MVNVVDASLARKFRGLDVALVERWWARFVLRKVIAPTSGRLVMYARHSENIVFVDQYITK
jgi:hypothetical protein